MRVSTPFASAFLGAVFLASSSHAFVVSPALLRVPTLLHQQDPEDSYHKGGNAKFQTPVVEPSRFVAGEAEEECEDVMIDFATGDELCWNEPPKHPRNVVPSKGGKADFVARTFNSPDVADDYHKGGNARYPPTEKPSKLDEGSDCEHPFIDFQSGDELCWNDYENSRF